MGQTPALVFFTVFAILITDWQMTSRFAGRGCIPPQDSAGETEKSSFGPAKTIPV